VRRAARIDAGHREIVDGLRAIGAAVTSLAAAGGGVPDLLASYRGRWWVLEVKQPAGPRGGTSADGQRLRDTQREWISRQRAPVYVVRGLNDALEALGAARKGAQEARS